MAKISFRATKFKLSKQKFTENVRQKILDAMTDAAQASFNENQHLVPIWTGESRGGLRALADGLDAQLDVYETDKSRPRKNPMTAHSDFEMLVISWENRIRFSYTNDAEGFNANDRQPGISPTSPWHFSASFARGIKMNMLDSTNNWRKLRLKDFTIEQRVSS